MFLIDELRAAAAAEESMFRQQLLKEDIARLTKLRSMAATAPSHDAFRKDGLYIGWTQNDMHTHRIRPALETFLTALYEFEHGEQTEDAISTLHNAWSALCRERMEKLIKCL